MAKIKGCKTMQKRCPAMQFKIITTLFLLSSPHIMILMLSMLPSSHTMNVPPILIASVTLEKVLKTPKEVTTNKATDDIRKMAFKLGVTLNPVLFSNLMQRIFEERNLFTEVKISEISFTTKVRQVFEQKRKKILFRHAQFF